MNGSDAETIIKLLIFGFIAILLIPVILTIAAAKREVVFDLIATAITVDGPWEIRGILVMVALIVFLAIPTWGILLIVYRNTL